MTKQDKVRFTFRLPAALREQIQAEADRYGISLNAVIVKILWDWVELNRKREEVEG